MSTFHVEVPRERLVEELGLARRAAERKATIPVYGFCRLKPLPAAPMEAPALELWSTDGDGALLSRCPAENVYGLAPALVPTRLLHDMLRAATSETVELKMSGTRVSVVAGNFTSSLNTMPAEEFPAQQPAPSGGAVRMPLAVLRDALVRTRHVVEGRATQPFMSGMLLRFADGDLVAMSTDSYRIAVARAEVPLDGPAPDEAIIPKKAMDDILATLSVGEPAADAVVTYARDVSRAYFFIGDRQVSTRLVDAKFPAIERHLPKPGGPCTADVDRDVWQAALRRVMVVATDDHIKVAVDVGAGALTMSLTGLNGDTSEAVRGDTTGAWRSGFSGRYLGEFLDVADTGTVRFTQHSPEKPALLEAAPGAVSHQYVLMPMALDEAKPKDEPAKPAKKDKGSKKEGE